jgi:hypothetical protein
LSKERKDPESSKKTELLDFWENCVPKSNKSESLTPKEAEMKLLAAALHGSVLTPEKSISRWFEWCHENCSEALEKLIQKKEFLRLKQGHTSWIISRKVLSHRNGI